MKGMNSTFTVSIPKVDNPQIFCDFRPISLLGCMYKGLAKLLADRLHKVIG